MLVSRDSNTSRANTLGSYVNVVSMDVEHVANALSCDVEDYFQVSAFEKFAPRDIWDQFDCRIPRNVDLALALLEQTRSRCTFFTLGWVAKKHPSVVRRIVDSGHEIASHGMQHIRIWQQSAAEFREDASAAKQLLEDVGGTPVRGYRAASWSLDERTPWAHEILAEIGYEYSSSIYPISHDHYGMPDAPAMPYRVQGHGILEVPATTVRLAGRNWPAAGGGYFRLFPYCVSRWMLRRVRACSNMPAVFYFHPWELDPAQPRIRGADLRARFRHYLNLGRFESRLTSLLHDFQWDRMDRIYLDRA